MGKDLDHHETAGTLEVLEELAEILHEHDFYVGFAADHGCEEPDTDDDPPCVDVPLGLLRRARSALTSSRASKERVRILEEELTMVARAGESCPGEDEVLEKTLRERIPALARRALRAPAQAPMGGADGQTIHRVEELEWALHEVLRHEDECFQHSHELTHRVWIDIPDLARRAVEGFDSEEDFCPFDDPYDSEAPF